MNHILPILRCAVPTLYVLTVAVYGLRFFGRGRVLAAHARKVFLATLGLHFLFLLDFVVVHRRIPLGSGPEVMTVIAFSTALAYAYVEMRTRNTSTGLFLLGFSTILQFASSGQIALRGADEPLLRNPWFALHALNAILGYSAFAVSTIYGLLFLLLYRELKARRFGRIYRRMPPLDVLAKMNIGAAGFGFAILTIAIMAGVFWASRLYPGFFRDPMFLITLIVWGIYAVCIVAHYRFGWRGHRTVYLSISGFLLMGLALIVVNLFLKTFHRFGT